MINEKTEELCLVVTERCNLNCSYCQSNKQFSHTMSIACAKEYIDKYLHVSMVSKPSITFMGGEPFVAFKTIKEIVAYVKQHYPQKEISYTIVTNGTLVHNEIQEWIKEHESILQITLSLDGAEESHNLNRCNSFHLIDIDFFKSLRKPIVNSVFTPDTIQNMSYNLKELHKHNFLIKGFIADGEQWSTQSIGVLATQLFSMIEYYLDNPHIQPFSLLSLPIYHLTTNKTIKRCGTECFYEVSISADGKEYACHRCTPFENNGTWKIPQKYLTLTNARFLLEDCITCPFDRICNACPASNASLKDNTEMSLINCQIRKLLFKSNAYFYLRMLTSENDYVALKYISDEKKKHIIQSSRTILELL